MFKRHGSLHLVHVLLAAGTALLSAGAIGVSLFCLIAFGWVIWYIVVDLGRDVD